MARSLEFYVLEKLIERYRRILSSRNAIECRSNTVFVEEKSLQETCFLFKATCPLWQDHELNAQEYAIRTRTWSLDIKAVSSTRPTYSSIGAVVNVLTLSIVRLGCYGIAKTFSISFLIYVLSAPAGGVLFNSFAF
jgi:hypothetical protein